MVNIFSDVVEGISKEVSKVQERSQEMLQGFNINSQMRDLERKKSKVLCELGDLIVDKYHHEKDVSEDTVKEKVAEVVGYIDQINLLQAELDTMNVQRDPNASQEKKAAAKAGYKSTPGFKCPHCGTPASREKKFCPACGGALHAEAAESKSESENDDGPLDVEPEEDDDSSDDVKAESDDDSSDDDEDKDKDED